MIIFLLYSINPIRKHGHDLTRIKALVSAPSRPSPHPPGRLPRTHPRHRSPQGWWPRSSHTRPHQQHSWHSILGIFTNAAHSIQQGRHLTPPRNLVTGSKNHELFRHTVQEPQEISPLWDSLPSFLLGFDFGWDGKAEASIRDPVFKGLSHVVVRNRRRVDLIRC